MHPVSAHLCSFQMKTIISGEGPAIFFRNNLPKEKCLSSILKFIQSFSPSGLDDHLQFIIHLS